MGARSVSIDSWLAPRWTRGNAALAKPTVASAAIRVPDRVSAQLALVFPSASPQLFVHEGARQALERRFKAAFPGPVVLSITDNRHSIISHSSKRGVLHARVHHMFLDAPASIIDALVRYVVRGDKSASAKIGRFIEDNASRLARRRPRAIPIHTRGAHHDLMAISQEVNARYFDGTVNALVTWGRRGPRRAGVARKAIRLGSYNALEKLIRIHPVLDRAWVPRYFIAYVLYHEMLHHVMPATRGNGRRNLHPPEFLERERLFRNYERALVWEKQHIRRLLRTS